MPNKYLSLGNRVAYLREGRYGKGKKCRLVMQSINSHLLIQHRVAEHLLYIGHCMVALGCNSEQNRGTPAQGLIFQGRHTLKSG